MKEEIDEIRKQARENKKSNRRNSKRGIGEQVWKQKKKVQMNN